MALLITTVYGCEPVALTASVAVIVKLNVPAALGVPFKTPVDAVKVMPVGIAPDETESVFVPVPPEATTVCK